MNSRVALLAAVVAPLVLGACQKTVTTHLPQGSAAYDAIAVAPEVANPAVYSLRAGDRIDVSVFREKDFSAQKVLVDVSGNIALPMLGTIPAAGMTQDELAANIRDRLAASFLRDPRITVSVETPALLTVSVEGEVEQPGVYEMQPGHTLLSAIAMARSTTDRAKVDQVLVFRTVNGERLGARFDLAMIRAGRAPDPVILPGDVVVVGYSQVRGVFQDFLKTAPLLNIFYRY